MGTKIKTRQRRQAASEISQAALDALLEATERVLARDGWQAMTSASVAKEAGFAKATVYYYFASKDALAKLVIERVASEFTTRMLDTLSRASRTNENVPEALCDAAVDFVGRRAALFGQWFHVWHLTSNEEHSARLERVADVIRGKLDAEKGALRPMDAGIASRVVLYSSLGTLLIAAREKPELLQSDAFRAEFRAMVLGQLGWPTTVR